MNPHDPAMPPGPSAELADSTAIATATLARHPQTGPLTDEGKDLAKRNSCRHGLTGAGLVLPPELQEMVGELRDEFAVTYGASTADDWRLVDQAALGYARFITAVNEQGYFVMNRSSRASCYWDQDQAVEAAKLGNRLASRPGWVVAHLEASLAGCRWLLERWKHLGWALEERGDWDDSERATALHLQGVPTALHSSAPIAAARGTREERRDLVASQVARLESRIGGSLVKLDAMCRELAVSGNGYMLEPTYHRLRRYENSARASYDRAIAELKARKAAADASKPAHPAATASPPTASPVPGVAPAVREVPAAKFRPPAPVAPVPPSKLPPAIDCDGFGERSLLVHGDLIDKCFPGLAAKVSSFASLRTDPEDLDDVEPTEHHRDRRRGKARRKAGRR